MELLTPDQMSRADQLTIAAGTDSYALMCNAGEAVYQQASSFWPDALRIAVLCGHGNNGGDGFVVARHYRQGGKHVYCFSDLPPYDITDAWQAQNAYTSEGGEILPLSAFDPKQFDLVIDAFYGAGMSRNITGEIADCINQLNQSGTPVCAVDLPSGISGDSGQIMGTAVKADLTVSFFRKKPGHLLQPGREHCGWLSLYNIGIEASVLQDIHPQLYENDTELWEKLLPWADVNSHKFSRGHVVVFSGGVTATGAARLSAAAAARAGAGLVTVIAPDESLPVHAAQLTSVMLRPLQDDAAVVEFFTQRKVRAAVLGPAFGDLQRASELTLSILQSGDLDALVLDADGLTAFQDQPQRLFDAAKTSKPSLIVTPHEGEFHRLFGVVVNMQADKVTRARQASSLSNAVVIYKGADTVIAAPDGRAAINSNGNALLATAGSGDVLTGIIASLSAQGMPAFEAACAAVWIHAETANYYAEAAPKGMIAEDMPALIPQIWARLAD